MHWSSVYTQITDCLVSDSYIPFLNLQYILLNLTAMLKIKGIRNMWINKNKKDIHFRFFVSGTFFFVITPTGSKIIELYIEPREVKVDLANFDLKLQENLFST